ncbi:crotonase/enoyl-CoA hydratase family protein [Egicoccus halophilus]|uniref:Enoyl-CoA hydratase n=1 Tax=Egicoccus halophilus TaxID=1670830 RepID=A0A8J3ETU5_9ACTN|nr:crotonase/enoyl-CoA hydratase family protein [Egicoccus halophilus]GGI04623.1 enoyl-CoA hydratase [Egicoccus halophilus]
MSVRTETRGRVRVITIDRPEVRNAVDRATAAALLDACQRADADPSVAVVVVTGAGGTFCAGADLHAVEDPQRRNRLERDVRGPMGPTRRTPTKPVIAAIEGHAVAGGLELALWCDLRVAADDAVLGVFCRRWGVPLIDGGTVRLPRVVGLGRALDLVLTGRPVDAQEALAMGLVTALAPSGRALESAVDLGSRLAELPQRTLLADLAATRAAFDRPLPDALLAEHDSGMAAIEAGGMADVARFRAGGGRSGAPA